MSSKILVISYSNINSDARVLRELSAVAEHGEVTTVGYGPQPKHATEHLQLPDDAKSLPQTIPGVAKLGLRRFNSVELAAPATKAALKLLAGRKFDAVVANDARALPLAFAASHGAPVWADLHEWAPEERTHVKVWKWFVAPLMDYLCEKYLPQCAETSTVGEEIVKLYAQHYGVRPRLVRNAAPYADLAPSPMAGDGRIRLVHSGGAVYGRNIEAMIEAVRDLDERFSLDLYLVPANDGGAYLGQLKQIAQDNPRIVFHDPVKPHEIPSTINAYDVGIFWIPPTNTNARLTLPNKIFDFIQARLAVAVGPTVEMANLVKQFELGVVSDDFEVETIKRTIAHLDQDQVADWKQASHRAASKLSFEQEAETIHQIMRSLLN